MKKIGIYRVVTEVVDEEGITSDFAAYNIAALTCKEAIKKAEKEFNHKIVERVESVTLLARED